MPVKAKKVVAKGAPTTTTTSTSQTGSPSGGSAPSGGKSGGKGKQQKKNGNPKAKKLERRPEDEKRLARAIRFWRATDMMSDSDIKARNAEVVAVLGVEEDSVDEYFTHILKSKAGVLLAVQVDLAVFFLKGSTLITEMERNAFALEKIFGGDRGSAIRAEVDAKIADYKTKVLQQRSLQTGKPVVVAAPAQSACPASAVSAAPERKATATSTVRKTGERTITTIVVTTTEVKKPAETSVAGWLLVVLSPLVALLIAYALGVSYGFWPNLFR